MCPKSEVNQLSISTLSGENPKIQSWDWRFLEVSNVFRATPGVRRGGRNCSHGLRTARTGQFGIAAVKFGRECKFRIFHKRWIIYTAKVGKAGLAPRVSLVYPSV